MLPSLLPGYNGGMDKSRELPSGVAGVLQERAYERGQQVTKQQQPQRQQQQQQQQQRATPTTPTRTAPAAAAQPGAPDRGRSRSRSRSRGRDSTPGPNVSFADGGGGGGGPTMPSILKGGAHGGKSCFTCGQEGHISRDCPNQNQNQNQNQYQRGSFRQHDQRQDGGRGGRGYQSGQALTVDNLKRRKPSDLTMNDRSAVRTAAMRLLADPRKCVYGNLKGGRRDGNLYPAITECPQGAGQNPCQREHFGMPSHYVLNDDARMAIFRAAGVTHWAN